MRITALFVRYGTDRYPGALVRFQSLLSERFTGARIWTIVIDNALPATHCEYVPGEDVVLMGGDNTAWEFSGWQKALRWSEAACVAPDWVLFATDAFEQLYSDFLQRFSTRLLENLSPFAVAIGHLDSYNNPVAAFGRTAQHWIRTSFFLLRFRDVVRIGDFHTVKSPQSLFSGNPAAPFRSDAPVDNTFQMYILGWLTGFGTGQGVAWHSRFDLTPETIHYFEAKSVAIVNEFSLSARLREQGIRLIDVTWAQAAGNSLQAQLDTPWQTQIAGRAVSRPESQE